MANGVLDLIGTPSLLATSTKPLVIGSSGAADLIMMTSGVERMRISSTGSTTLSSTVDFTLANDDYLLAKDTGGTAVGILKIDSSDFTVINAKSAKGINLSINSSAEVQITDDKIAFAAVTASNCLIATSSVDAADSNSLRLSGGATWDPARSAGISLCGNEHASVGLAYLFGGAVATGHVDIGVYHASALVRFKNSSDAITWQISSPGVLSQDATNGSDLVLSKGSTSVRQTVVNTISAAGTVSGDATALTGVINNVTTVAASTGVRAWAAGTGSVLYVKNSGANALLVYPDTGGTINAGATDAGVSIATGATCILMKIAALTWIACEAPAA